MLRKLIRKTVEKKAEPVVTPTSESATFKAKPSTARVPGESVLAAAMRESDNLLAKAEAARKASEALRKAQEDEVISVEREKAARSLSHALGVPVKAGNLTYGGVVESYGATRDRMQFYTVIENVKIGLRQGYTAKYSCWVLTRDGRLGAAFDDLAGFGKAVKDVYGIARP